LITSIVIYFQPEYLAPEIIESGGYSKNVDWWALGVLMFEMSTGVSPFRGKGDRQTTYEKILRGVVKFPKDFDPVVKNLVKKLLVKEELRLGYKVCVIRLCLQYCM
jgi:serine/threonine protein kinase